MTQPLYFNTDMYSVHSYGGVVVNVTNRATGKVVSVSRSFFPPDEIIHNTNTSANALKKNLPRCVYGEG